MANALVNEALIQQEIDQQVDNPKLSFLEKKSIRKSIMRQSILNAPKNTSFQTILSISNTMCGSSLVILPVLFSNSGIFSSLIIALIFCIISCKTCTLLVTHNKKEELDLPQTILRILGTKYRTLFNVTNIIILYFAGVVTFILICTMLYPLIEYICSTMNIPTAKKTEIVFNQVSYQWCGIIYMGILFLILIQKNLSLIIKLVQYGVISVVFFILFIIFKGFMNIKQIKDVNLFTFDIVTLCGVFSLAFMVHQVIVPIIKSNLIQQNNIRDISISFGWTWLLYSLVGCFGALTITNIPKIIGTDGSTVLDYMEQDIFTYIIMLLQFFQLSTVFPLLTFITRSQFFGIIYDLNKPPQYQFIIYTIAVSITTLLIQCLNISVSLVLSLSGAVIGFFQLYFIPIMLHLMCLYGKKRKILPSLINQSEDSQYLENPDLSLFEEADFDCLDHQSIKERFPSIIRFIVYGIILFMGGIVAIVNLISVFK